MCSLLSLNVDFMPPPSIEIVLNQENVSMSKDDNHQYNCNCIYTDIYIIKIIPKKKHLLIDGILYSTFLFNGADIADNSREALNFKHATVRQCTSSTMHCDAIRPISNDGKVHSNSEMKNWDMEINGW